METGFPRSVIDAYATHHGLTWSDPFEFDGGWAVEMYRGGDHTQRVIVEPDGTIHAFMAGVPLTVTLTQWARRREGARRPRR